MTRVRFAVLSFTTAAMVVLFAACDFEPTAIGGTWNAVYVNDSTRVQDSFTLVVSQEAGSSRVDGRVFQRGVAIGNLSGYASNFRANIDIDVFDSAGGGELDLSMSIASNRASMSGTYRASTGATGDIEAVRISTALAAP